jgi:sec-independent protein translocase protein TatA
MSMLLLAFGLPSPPDMIVILVLVVLLFGAKKLPELARGLGQSLGEFKKARDDFEREIHKTATPPPAPPAEQLMPPAEAPSGTVPVTAASVPAQASQDQPKQG